MKKLKSNDYDTYEEDLEQVSEKELELIDSYMDEEIDNHLKEKEKKEKKLRKANEKILEEELDPKDLEEYEIEDDFVEKKKETNKEGTIKKVLNAILVILFICIVLACIDIVSITKYNKGPYFAIPIHTYDDGGTKEYYGIGYKVIKYNQVQGRRDTEVGTWGLKYNVDPIYVEVVDLAIEFNDDAKDAYARYYKQLLIVTGTLKEINVENNEIVLSYEDEGEKYSINVVCNMETDQESLSILEPKYEISAMGTMVGFDPKTENTRPVIYLDNCFAQQ